MKLETWAAFASLGLAAMFVALIISLDMFLIGPDGKGPSSVVDPGSLLIQETSISGAPCTVLASFVYFMGKGYKSNRAGIVLIGAGTVVIVGMAIATTLVPDIPSQYVVGGVDIVSYVFLAIGAGIAGMGVLLAISSSKRAARNLDDLR